MYYYVYAYFDPKTIIPFYVGYGKNLRYLDHLKEAKKNLTASSNEIKLNKIKKILRSGSEPIIKILDDNLSREQACEFEEFLIEMIGRLDLKTGPLTNRTSGGDGTRGWSDDQKKEVRDRNERLGLVPPNMKGQTYTRGKEKSYIPAIEKSSGKRIQASLVDPRWDTGDIFGINTGVKFNDEWLLKNSIGVSKLKWWNNGIKSIRSENCPGPEYIRGRGKVKW